jgi:hypothetical protein
VINNTLCDDSHFFSKFLPRLADWAAHGFFFDIADPVLNPFEASVGTHESARGHSSEANDPNCFTELTDEDGQFTRDSGPYAAPGLSEERADEQLPLSPPHNERDERDTASPALGTDMDGFESGDGCCARGQCGRNFF